MATETRTAHAHPLEPSPGEMRAMADAAVSFLIEFIQRLPDSPASDMSGVESLVRRLHEPAPETGRPFDSILEVVAESAGKAFNTAGPGYFAFIPGGGLFASALADFLACGVNRFVNVWNAAPAFAKLEWNVIRWLCELFDYPDTARGILTSGGSMANFSAIVTARRALLPEDFLAGTLYASAQTHASVVKAAVLAGFPEKNVREVSTTPDLKLDVDALRSMLQADRAEGLVPFCLVVNAGTTNTGAVDPIAEMVRLAKEEGMWAHVDAAYGGFFQLTERGRTLFRGIEAADSITLDPHKAMFLPYGTGSLLVRDGARLREAHTVKADYLQDLAAEQDIPNFADYSPELSRDFRGLRVWLPLQLHGVRAFRAALDEKLDLARFLFEGLRETRGFELPWEPELTVIAFRYLPQNGDPERFNRRLLERINASRRVFLSSTTVHGRFTLRACIVSHRTHRDRVEEGLEIIREAARQIEFEGA